MGRGDWDVSQEVRVVDERTGGEKGSKLARFSLIPPEFMWALAEHYGIGARKYADRNWERGYKWSLSIDALERHLVQWKMGETFDPETGSNHLIAAAWHCCALFIYQLRGLGTDDVRTPARDLPTSTFTTSTTQTNGANYTSIEHPHYDRTSPGRGNGSVGFQPSKLEGLLGMDIPQQEREQLSQYRLEVGPHPNIQGGGSSRG